MTGGGGRRSDKAQKGSGWKSKLTLHELHLTHGLYLEIHNLFCGDDGEIEEMIISK